MELIKQDVFIENIEEGNYWAEYANEDDEQFGFWLKKLPQVYVLTEDELEQVKFEKFHEGYDKGVKHGEVPF